MARNFMNAKHNKAVKTSAMSSQKARICSLLSHAKNSILAGWSFYFYYFSMKHLSVRPGA